MTTRNIVIESPHRIPVEEQQVEVVERKGLGHPDYICDAVAEHISVELNRAYQREFGSIQHYNVDKGLLVAGESVPRLGGGKMIKPMTFIVGDRATYEWNGRRIDIDQLVHDTTVDWIETHLRFVDPRSDVVIQNVLDMGSPELTDIFHRRVIGANDTSAAVGYAPLSITETLVLETERYLNSPEFKAQFPAAGEDIKVMGVRQGRELSLTVALAFVDRFVDSEQDYFTTKGQVLDALNDFVSKRKGNLRAVNVALNTLDQPGRGLSGMYLTVTGTSAESGDSGQVGRGNRVNGLIALNRPMGTEAAAGKNPVSHVGKIYSFLALRVANEVYQTVPGIREVYIWLVSQIGAPIDQPLVASAQLVLQPNVRLESVADSIRGVIDKELANIFTFSTLLAQGVYPVC